MKGKNTITPTTTKKKIEYILDKMVNVNNVKVDTIRKLFLAIDSDNYDSLFDFLIKKEVVKKEFSKPKNKQVWML